MNKLYRQKRILALTTTACVAMLLAACGGGGGGGEDTKAEEQAATPMLVANEAGTDSGRTDASSTPTPAPAPAPAPAPTASPAPSPSSTPVASAQIALPAASTCGLSNFAAEMLALVNQARANGRVCGSTQYPAASPLGWNTRLFAASERHSADMASNSFFSHTGSDGTTFSQRITGAGYAYRAAAENIAAGQRSVADVVQGWLQSPGHCANIMNGNLTEIAVACVKGSSQYGTYWTMDLGRPL